MEETKHILKEDLLFLYAKIKDKRNILKEEYNNVSHDKRQTISPQMRGISMALHEFDNFLKELE